MAGHRGAGKVVIVGAGRVGLCLAGMLTRSGGHEVVLGDCTEEALAAAAQRGLAAQHVDASRPDQLARLASGARFVAAAVPDRLCGRVAQAATAAGAHYLDFSEPGEDVRLAGGAAAGDRAFLPGCGVSPGLVDALAYGLACRLDPGCDLDIRVGAIPARRTNRLGYGLIWNLDGLIAEYTEPCTALADGQPVRLPPLSGCEEFDMEGQRYEAFLTAGSVGALAALAATHVRNLVFRTVRYPGHLDYMQLLLDDLGLAARRDLLATVLRNGLPAGEPDALVIDIRATGTRGGKPAAERFARRIEPRGEHGALAFASAAHAAALIDLAARGALAGPGLRSPVPVPHEVLARNSGFAGLFG